MTIGTVDCLFAYFLVFIVFLTLGSYGVSIMLDCLELGCRHYTVYKGLIKAGGIVFFLLLCLPFYQIVKFVQ